MGEVDERALFVRGPVVVFKWRNAEGWPVEYVSTNAEEVFGYSADSFKSGDKSYAEVIFPDDLTRVGEEVTTASASGLDSFVHEPYRIVHADGSTRWLNDVTQIVRDDVGHPTHYLGYVVDISARVQAEEEKLRLQHQLLHSQKLESLGVLAGGVAHDFNNLLTGILGEAGLARRQLDKGLPGAGERLQQIERLAMRAAELTRQLLAYSGKGRFVVEPTDLCETVREVSSMLETVVSKKAVLRLRLEPVPAVNADRTQLHQVVMNLITNASDALGEQSGTISISTGTEEVEGTGNTSPPLHPGRYVLLTVTDDGVGMDLETHSRLFEPFFSTKSSSRGLGMSAISGILRSHKGGIRVESTPGKGSTLTVLLPASDEVPRAAARDSIPPDWQGQGTVLIIDDEPSIRRLASNIFENLGFETITAENGLDGLVRLRENQGAVVLILLDLMMPVMGGEETLEGLRLIDPNVPVIMSSGYDRNDSLSRVPSRNVAGFLQKPYGLEHVEALARRVLRSR